MPIVKPSPTSPPVNYPKTNYLIAKYLDITKYISLLQRQSLFFCRVDKLEDQFEGTFPKINFQLREKKYKHLRDTNYFTASLTDDDIIEKVKKDYEDEKKFKEIFCVNCWNKYEDESAALWKIYSDFSKGIMLKSSISQLCESFDNYRKDLFLSEICYRDYNNEVIPDGNQVYPIIHKQLPYKYEDEIRVINRISDSPRQHDWTKEEVQEGIYIRVELNELIEEIVVAPSSPNWFFELIKDVTKKYGLKKNIIKSKLSDTA